MRILISGASVAGPALAYWLGRFGFRPTIVEIAPALRTGGNAVDFRGPLHLGVLTRMGVLDDLRAVQTGGTVMRFVDDTGARLMEWPAGLRNYLNNRRWFLNLTLKIAADRSTNLVLPEYQP